MQVQRKFFNEPETVADKLREKHATDAVTLPVIVHPGGWDVPKDLIEHIQAMRLKQLQEDPDDFLTQAVDAEVAAYLMTASLEAPLTHEAAQVYLYAARRYFIEVGMKEIPAFMNIENLSRCEESAYDRLKRWIRKQQFRKE